MTISAKQEERTEFAELRRWLLAAALANTIGDLPPFAGIRVVITSDREMPWRIAADGAVEISAELSLPQARQTLEVAYESYLSIRR